MSRRRERGGETDDIRRRRWGGLRRSEGVLGRQRRGWLKRQRIRRDHGMVGAGLEVRRKGAPATPCNAVPCWGGFCPHSSVINKETSNTSTNVGLRKCVPENKKVKRTACRTNIHHVCVILNTPTESRYAVVHLRIYFARTHPSVYASILLASIHPSACV